MFSCSLDTVPKSINRMQDKILLMLNCTGQRRDPAEFTICSYYVPQGQIKFFEFERVSSRMI